MTQSLYALKLRATIIGYISPLIVYGSLDPLLGKTYLLHSRDHLSSPCLACIWTVYFLRSVLLMRSFSFGIMLNSVYLCSLQFRSFYVWHARYHYYYSVTRSKSQCGPLCWTRGHHNPLPCSQIQEWSFSILYSICKVFSLPSFGLNTSFHPHGGGSGCVNVGSTPYIPSYVPSSTTLFPLNVVIMINPP